MAKKRKSLPEGYDGARFPYPYSVQAPMVFAGVFDGCKPKAVQNNGFLQVRLNGKAEMDTLMAFLVKQETPEAQAIVQGLMASMV